MLRIAVPNKGTLSAPAAQMLREAGYRQRSDAHDLVCRDPDHNVEFFYLRPRDIATYVGSGDLDLGITGRDLLVDADCAAREIMDLDFGGATFRFAARPEALSVTLAGAGTGALTEVGALTVTGSQPPPAVTGSQPQPVGAGSVRTEPIAVDLAGLLAGRRIATAYPGVVARYLATHGLTAEVVRLDGAVENAIGLGVADVIADVVATGSTLRQAGLVPMGESIMESSAILIGRADGPADGPVGGPVGGSASQLLRRLQGVLVARRYVMLTYDVRADLLPEASALTPGIESPTISPLHREGWVAVQAMILRADMHDIMDALYALGARAILVTNIHACRL